MDLQENIKRWVKLDNDSKTPKCNKKLLNIKNIKNINKSLIL